MYSSRPYLARALYQWLLDNELTPYVVVDAEQPGVEVPRQFVQNGQIVLNMAPTAVRDFFMENESFGFSARFGGQPMRILVPMTALVAIYARENGVGMVFGHEPVLPVAATQEDESDSHLASVDSTESETEASSEDASEETSSRQKKPHKKKPSLRVIK